MEQENQEAPPEEEKPQFKEKIVEITRGGKLRKVKVRELPIDWEGKKEIVEIKKMCFGERAQYSEKFVNIRIKGEFNDVSVSLAEMQIQAIIMGTHKAPFPLNEDYIRYELDGDIGEFLHKQIDEFNKLTPQTKKKLDGQSSTEPTTSKSTESSTTSDSSTTSE